jgi:hypothetical protein
MQVLGERLDMRVGTGVGLYQNRRQAPVVQGPSTFKFLDLDSLASNIAAKKPVPSIGKVSRSRRRLGRNRTNVTQVL